MGGRDKNRGHDNDRGGDAVGLPDSAAASANIRTDIYTRYLLLLLLIVLPPLSIQFRQYSSCALRFFRATDTLFYFNYSPFT